MLSNKKKPSQQGDAIAAHLKTWLGERIFDGDFWFKRAMVVFLVGLTIGITSIAIHFNEVKPPSWSTTHVVKYAEKLMEAAKLQELLYHVAAVFLELGLVLLVVEKFLRNYERQKETERHKEQLRLIKSAMFRSELKDVYLADFRVLKGEGKENDHEICLRSIQCPIGQRPESHHETLKAWQDQFIPERESGESALEKNLVARFDKVIVDHPDIKKQIIREYVKAKDAWSWFKEFAVSYNFPGILEDVIEIEHIIADVDAGEMNEVRLRKVWRTGIKKFIDYAVELTDPGAPKSQQSQQLFISMMKEYVEAEAAHAQKEAEEERRRMAHRKAMEEALPENLSPLH